MSTSSSSYHCMSFSSGNDNSIVVQFQRLKVSTGPNYLSSETIWFRKGPSPRSFFQAILKQRGNDSLSQCTLTIGALCRMDMNCPLALPCLLLIVFCLSQKH
uniref:uncharacterized protein LOC105349964 n=1 Tax=Fragaria vesca subsp. vesca TaxID=101020 RepID=UPI0005CB747F|nr:PREDICTED: uncharacterized protein LOC105349964 [Fragaria vesca subsp. vesca]